MMLSIIIPSYNESGTIIRLLDKLASIDFTRMAPGVEINSEIIIVDDGSIDGTTAVVESGIKSNEFSNVRLIKRSTNGGKGVAVREGLSLANGEIVIIQDADLEYDPVENYPVLLRPFFDDRRAEVVFGSRFLSPTSLRPIYFWHLLGNHVLTLITNIVTGATLTDMETGYKVMHASVVKTLLPLLSTKDFRIEPELAIRILRRRWRIFEVPITYTSRTYEEGKKIGWRDGFLALGTIMRLGLWDWPINSERLPMNLSAAKRLIGIGRSEKR